MNEHEKRAYVYGGVRALKEAGILFKDMDGQVKVAQVFGGDPYDMYGYDQYGAGGGYDGGYGADYGGGDMGGGYADLLNEYYAQMAEQGEQGPQGPPASPGLSAPAGAGIGAAGGGVLGAGLGGLGGYYGSKAVNDLFGTDVDPNTLATILGLIGAAGGAGAGGALGAQHLQGLGATQPQG